jgi:hypothetical protein
MYDHRNGYFYYLKYPLLTNKVPYLRWSQAWMLYALSFLLSDGYTIYSGALASEAGRHGRIYP